jgi:chromosomal replication initiation ATPase DnaA
MNLHDTDLTRAVLRICAQRGIRPADSLGEQPLDRRDFHRAQIVDRIHNRWHGRYDQATPAPPVATWIRRHLADPERHPSLLLVGVTGTGKTWNAVAALRAIGDHHADHGRGLNWAAVTHPDLADQMRPKTDGSHEHALDRYLDADLLILDDLGAGMAREWTTDWLQRLVDHRWVRRAPTIYTTNLGDQLRQAVGDRVHSRIGDAAHIQLQGDDRRWAQ